MGGNHLGRLFCLLTIAGSAAVMAFIATTGNAGAVSVLNSCAAYCHGVPPRDGVRKGSPPPSGCCYGQRLQYLPYSGFTY